MLWKEDEARILVLRKREEAYHVIVIVKGDGGQLGEMHELEEKCSTKTAYY